MLVITVCIGSSCHLKCSYEVVSEFERLLKQFQIEDQVTIKASFCLGNCTKAVSVRINDGEVLQVGKGNVEAFFRETILNMLP